MISISKQDATVIVQLLARVQIQGTEAPTFVGVVQRLEKQLSAPSQQSVEIKDE